MGLFEHWPYVNFHDMNLDWIIKKIKNVEISEANSQASAEASAESAAASQLSADAALESQDAAHQSELNAAQSEENAADSEASAKNYADHIADPVGGLVTDWLDEHVTPTTPIVDDTLTISGAAADAKVTGVEINNLKNDLYFDLYGPHDTKDSYYFFRGSSTNYGIDSTNANNRITISNGPEYVTAGGPDLIISENEITITHKYLDVVRFGVYIFQSSGTVGEWSGWLDEPYTIPQNTLFKLMVKYLDESEIPENFSTDPIYTGLAINVTGNYVVPPKDYYPVKIVAKDGSAKYSTIQAAINDAVDGDIIYVKSGLYEEAVVNTKQITIMGENKHSTVLFNTTGVYATPPLWTCSGRIENLTVYAWNRNNVPIESITNLGYALHLDQKWDPVADRRHITINNCIFKSDFNDCIGCGMDASAYIEISNTICEATHKSGLKVHPFPTTGASKILLRNNVFKKGVDDNAYGILFHTGGTDGIHFNTINVEAYNNIAKTYAGFNSNCFIMDEYNYGNTLNTMNNFTL